MLIFLGLHRCHANLEMRGAEINEPRAVFVKKYVLSTFRIEQVRHDAIPKSYFTAINPVASILLLFSSP